MRESQKPDTSTGQPPSVQPNRSKVNTHTHTMLVAKPLCTRVDGFGAVTGMRGRRGSPRVRVGDFLQLREEVFMDIGQELEELPSIDVKHLIPSDLQIGDGHSHVM